MDRYKTDDEEVEWVLDKLDKDIIEYIDLKSNITTQIDVHNLMELLIKTDFLERRGYRSLEIEKGVKYLTLHELALKQVNLEA